MDKHLETITDLESEKGLLGCCLINPNQVFSIFEKCGHQAMELFTHESHRAIWKALLDEVTDGNEPDLLQLTVVLKKQEITSNTSWIGQLTELQDCVPSALNLDFYLKSAQAAALKRKAGAFLTSTYKKLLEKNSEPGRLLLEAEGELMGINNYGDDEKLANLSDDGIPLTYERLDEYRRGTAQQAGLSTGYKFFDEKTGGLCDSEVYIIAGRPGGGKTAFGLNLAANVGLGRNGKEEEKDIKRSVLFFSMEMSLRELSDRFVFSESGANMVEWRTGHVQNEDIQKLQKVRDKLRDLNIYIDVRPGLSISQIAHRARQAKLMHNIDLIVIDYLQLATSGTRMQKDNRQEEVAIVSKGFKKIAKDLSVPIVALAQLNRNAARGKHEEPNLADLRESGQIEQDADFVGLLHQVTPRTEEEENAFVETLKRQGIKEELHEYTKHTKLIIAKQRNGPCVKLDYLFHKGQVRFDTFNYQQPRETTQTAKGTQFSKEEYNW